MLSETDGPLGVSALELSWQWCLISRREVTPQWFYCSALLYVSLRTRDTRSNKKESNTEQRNKKGRGFFEQNYRKPWKPSLYTEKMFIVFEVQTMSRIKAELWYQLWDTVSKNNIHYSRFFYNFCSFFISWSFCDLFSWWQLPGETLGTACISHTTNTCLSDATLSTDGSTEGWDQPRMLCKAFTKE